MLKRVGDVDTLVGQRDKYKRSEARRSGDLQVPWINHLKWMIQTRNRFLPWLSKQQQFFLDCRSYVGTNRIQHWCSVGTGKSQSKGPPFQWETRLVEGWDFPVDAKHQWSILFLTYHYRIALRMTLLCLNMEVSEVNERNKNIQQSQTILVPKCVFCSN